MYALDEFIRLVEASILFFNPVQGHRDQDFTPGQEAGCYRPPGQDFTQKQPHGKMAFIFEDMNQLLNACIKLPSGESRKGEVIPLYGDDAGRNQISQL